MSQRISMSHGGGDGGVVQAKKSKKRTQLNGYSNISLSLFLLPRNSTGRTTALTWCIVAMSLFPFTFWTLACTARFSHCSDMWWRSAMSQSGVDSVDVVCESCPLSSQLEIMRQCGPRDADVTRWLLRLSSVLVVHVTIVQTKVSTVDPDQTLPHSRQWTEEVSRE